MALNSLTHHSTYLLTVVTGEVAPLVNVRIEDEVVRAARIALEQRTRPMAAERTGAVEKATVVIPRSGEEKTITVGTCHLSAVHTVLSCPCPSAIVE